jgi:hypothetical protein
MPKSFQKKNKESFIDSVDTKGNTISEILLRS